MANFKLISDYVPKGDQPQAIDKIAKNLTAGVPHQVLLGVTGSGKTFTMANVIERVQRPTLVISHNGNEHLGSAFKRPPKFLISGVFLRRGYTSFWLFQLRA